MAKGLAQQKEVAIGGHDLKRPLLLTHAKDFSVKTFSY